MPDRHSETFTERLYCSRPSASATPSYERLFLDPAVEAWLRPEPLEPFSRADIDRLLRHDRAHWQRHGFGPWALVERATGEFVGRGGLAWTTVEGKPMVELPWAVLPEFHGRGLASEQASAALEMARDQGLERVISLTLPDNLASRRVMEKAGLEFIREVQHAGLPHVLYGIEFPRGDR